MSRLLILGAVVIAVLRGLMVAGGASFERVFNGTDTRADALLMGCLLGVSFGFGRLPTSDRWQRVYRAVGWCSVAVLAALCGRRDFHWPYAQTWLYPLASLAGAGVLLAVLTCEGGTLKAFLESRTLVYVGKVSYGLYLWHAPVFQLLITPGAPL